MKTPESQVVTADLRALRGSGGAVWNLPHGGDLDANLVRLGPEVEIAEHANDSNDILVVVTGGSVTVTVDDESHDLGADSLILIPKATRRSIMAGTSGATYLSVHRKGAGLQIGKKPQ